MLGAHYVHCVWLCTDVALILLNVKFCVSGCVATVENKPVQIRCIIVGSKMSEFVAALRASGHYEDCACNVHRGIWSTPAAGERP